MAWSGDHGARPAEAAAAAFVKEIGVLRPDVNVMRHYPEAFLVRFFHQHHCTNAVGRREIPFGATKLQIRQWRLEG